MIFIDGERKTNFSKEREILKSIFPNSFDTDKPAPIIIQRKKGTYEMATLYKPAVTDVPIGQRMVPPPPTIFSVYGRIKGDDNVMHRWNYSETYPISNGDGTASFKQKGIQIHHGMNIDAEKDFEKLVFLYFYSKGFVNNAQSSKFALYEFVIPAAESKKRIDSATVLYKYMTELLVPDTRMSYAKLKSVMTLLNIKGNGIEEDERTKIYDAITANRGEFVKRYEQAKANVEAMDANSSQPVSNVASMVKKMIKEGVIIESDGMWRVANKEGAEKRILTEARGTKKADKENALIQYLAISPMDVEYLESL